MLTEFSTQLADVAAAAAPSVVQVLGRRRPASGLVHSQGVVVTTMRAIGGNDRAKVREEGGSVLDAELAGWDPATSLAILRVTGLTGPPARPAATRARVGHVALAIARSWSNAVTVSAGVVSVIGGPLATGRRQSIEEIIRTTAPMHDGFSGGALLGTTGELLGITTALSIRGLSVAIPAAIAWQAASTILEHGHVKRGYLGIAGHPVVLPLWQRPTPAEERGLLVAAVTDDSPAARAGVLVGDVLLSLDQRPVTSPDDLIDRLTADHIGRAVTLGLLRGGSQAAVSVTVGERLGP